jgi:hypothetical protein
MIGEAPRQARRRGPAAPAADGPVDIRPQPAQEKFHTSVADVAVYGGSAGSGKALAIDTPIPTPRGWVHMGDLRVGDLVFGLDGKPTPVTYCSGVMYDHPCYKMVFDDGAEIVADAEHWWWTFTAADLSALMRRDPAWRAKRRAGRVSRSKGTASVKFVEAIRRKNRLNPPPCKPSPDGGIWSTEEIAGSLRVGKSGRCNHAVPVGPVTEGEDPGYRHVDPYLLGLWLGDGTTVYGEITTADPEIVQAVRDAGYRVVKRKTKYAWGVTGLWTHLRRAGVAGNKHIPRRYLQATADQRLALLQGLMDTDGTVDRAKGSVSFTSTKWELAIGVHELACSLGWKPNRTTARIPMLNGRPCATAYTVAWLADRPVFRLPRKLALQKLTEFRQTTRFRYVEFCGPVDSVPVCCITVGNPDGMFLAGWNFIPTHNSWSLLMEPLRHAGNPGFSAVLFRRTYPELTAPGGLWPESFRLYPYLNATPNESKLTWWFPSGARVQFSHMQHEKNVLGWLGSQIPLVAFDQLETFTEHQFWYMLSRNRSVCGVRPYVRATANPRPGWLADLLAWWIDPASGYPRPERAGVLRWFVRREDVMFWAGTPEELVFRHPGSQPKSLTFIPAKLTDNPILMSADPDYAANLAALPRVERERLEKGNWLIGDLDGEFPPEYFARIYFDEWPPDLTIKVMALDPSKGKDARTGDFSAWILLGVDRELTLWVDCDIDNARVVEPSPHNSGQRNMTDDGLALLRGFGPQGVIVETTGFQHWICVSLQRAAISRSLHLPLYTFQSRVNKQQRIRTLTPYLAQGRLRVRDTPGGRVLVQQLRDFPDPHAHDDAPDALVMAERLADYLLSGKGTTGEVEPAR